MIKIRHLVLGIGLIPASVFATNIENISINGYSSFEYEQQTSKMGNGDKNGSLDADLLDLVFNFRPGKRVRVSADVTWEHGSATEDEKGNVALEYGFSEFVISDKLKFRVGKFLTPFGIFNEIHTSKPSFLSVKEAASTNKPERIVDNAYRFFPRWGTGISIVGDIYIGKNLLDYNIMISNGEGSSNDFEEDHRPSKAITARTRYSVNNTQLGMSLYHDSDTGNLKGSLSSMGAQVIQSFSKFVFIFEIVKGVKHFVSDNVGTVVKQLGYFAQASYFLTDDYVTYFRYESIDPNTERGKSSDGGNTMVLGFNLTFDGNYIVKIENNYFKGQSEASGLSTFTSQSYNEVKAAIVVGF